MKKILLINSNTEILPYPVAPLGISLLASSLKNKYNIKVFDAAFNSTQELVSFVHNFKPDYIGIGLRNIDNVTMNKCKWYIKEIKEQIVDPVQSTFNIPVIIGGSGFSIAPVEILDFFNADYGIIGEAEETFNQLICLLEKNEQLYSLENVISRNNKNIKIKETDNSTLKLPKANIDQIIDFSPYQERGSYPVQTKRGCSHKCIYCSYPGIEGKNYRLRPVNEIVDEIEETNQRIPGVSFEFVDSVFNSPLSHAIAICKEIIKRKIKTRLRTMGVNPGGVNNELILLMKDAGFSQIDCTPDSASEIMLKNYRKNFKKSQLIKAAEIIQQNNMPTMWFFMMGAPGETEETILETFEFIDQYIYKEDMVHITEGIRIIPGTELHQIALQEKLINKKMNPINPIFYVSPTLGKEKLSQILKREIAQRNNVVNSTDTSPSRELMQLAIKYRKENKVNEPLFRTLLKIQNKNLS